MPSFADTLNQPPPPSSHHRSGSSIQFSESDRFFSKLLSKDQSINNPSFRVYYGGSTGSIPFVWETAPGTPKHVLFLDDAARRDLPPLTPPPGFEKNTLVRRRSVGDGNGSVACSSRRSLVDGILQRLLSSSKSNKADVAPSNYLSSSPSSNSASSEWNSGDLLDRSRRRKWQSLSMQFRKRDDAATAPLTKSPDSTLCFGGRREPSKNIMIKSSSEMKATSLMGCFRA